MFDADLAPGFHNYWKSSDLDELADGALDTMVALYEETPSTGAMVVIDQFGGAVARVANDATAFSHRHAAYDLIVIAVWTDPAETEAHVG